QLLPVLGLRIEAHRPTTVARQVVRSDRLLPLRMQVSRLHSPLQVAHVPGVRCCFEGRDRLLRESLRPVRDAGLGRTAGEKMLGEQHDLLPPLLKRRDPYDAMLQPVAHILEHLALGDEVVRVLAHTEDEPAADRRIPVAPHPPTPGRPPPAGTIAHPRPATGDTAATLAAAESHRTATSRPPPRQ